ncbi:MAG: esterase-like activity of phytase family protein [Aphanocapsa sp. GSE-SYN-MK-11-07L]|nr:esterase-like activity of phytase family protein [Aphanocapsa sp. GSE-SYN-MK-11-07L]
MALLAIALTALSFGLSGCDLPQVRAEDRIFLNLSLDFLGEYRLPAESQLEQTRIGGLSGLTYDRTQNQFYAISDDRSQYAPARFYTLKLATQANSPQLARVDVTGVTLLKNQQGQPYPTNRLDPEGIALTPSRSVFIASEGVKDQAPPFVDQFDLNGAWMQALNLPDYYFSNPDSQTPAQGVGSNLGFESLTLNPSGDRLFAATESALLQDAEPNYTGPIRSRLLHYLVGDLKPILVSEHLYALEPTPAGATFHGLVELLALDNGGHFLSLERTFTPGQGITAKLFQVNTGSASNVSTLAILKGDLAGIQPVCKQSLFDLSQLGLTLGNLEGMALGPILPDGSQSLLLVSDDNFNPKEPTQFLLFRFNQGRQKTS